MDKEVDHNKKPRKKAQSGDVTVSKTFDIGTINKCMDALCDLSLKRKELLDRVWELEHDTDLIREQINGMLS